MTNNFAKFIENLKQQLQHKNTRIQNFSIRETLLKSTNEKGDKTVEVKRIYAKIILFRDNFNEITKQMERITTSTRIAIETEIRQGSLEYALIYCCSETKVTPKKYNCGFLRKILSSALWFTIGQISREFLTNSSLLELLFP